jgi:phospholipid/cholesterol/gamma-HCH transport system substrate-binding protein
MRSATGLEIKVGLLIIAGLVSTLVLVLLSGRLHFEHNYRVRAFLPDAGGLRAHSPVTLSGIRIGEVERLGTVEDARGNVVVTLKISEEYRLPVGAKLTIASSGIFGDSYMAFAGTHDPKSGLLPVDGSAEVVANPGFFDTASQQAQKILEGASDLLGNDNRAEIRRLVTSAADLAEAATKLAHAAEAQTTALGDTLARVRALSDQLKEDVATLSKGGDQLLKHLDGTLGTVEARVDQLGGKAADSLARFDALVARSDHLVAANAEELTQALASVRTLAERGARIAQALSAGDGVLGQLLISRDLAKDLNSTAVDLSRTASFIADHPEALVFGASKEETAAEHARREREKVRRAYNENYGGIPLVVRAPDPPPAAPAAPRSGTP